ncbi:MAG: LysM peptidoglycan-binding domain-containing protein [Phycisphaerales bacterium]|nr:MAG: LysM peptidoglycan-binding domain-containing protein [Phycisphaerales bacterium]
MADRSGRLIGGFALLVGLWVAVYWLWQPPEERVRVSFSDAPLATASGGTSPVGDGGGRVFTLDQRLAGEPPTPRRMAEPIRGPGEAAPSSSEPSRAGGAGRDEGAPRVRPPEFRTYVIQRGDTFGRIAVREFGSARYESAIARANPFKDPRRLVPGETLQLPTDPANIQGVVEESGERRAAEAPTPVVIEYVVQPRDTLGGIALRFYGSARETRQILDANRDRLQSADQIRVGQTLRIPSPSFPAGDGGGRR